MRNEIAPERRRAFRWTSVAAKVETDMRRELIVCEKQDCRAVRNNNASAIIHEDNVTT